MTERRRVKIYELPEGATYVRPSGYGCMSYERIRRCKTHKYDVFVGYRLKTMTKYADGWASLLNYELYELRQWDFPICKPIDSGGCYTGDISGFTTGIFPDHCHPCEAITVDEMFKRMKMPVEVIQK